MHVLTTLFALSGALVAVDPTGSARDIEVGNVLLASIEQVEVPAGEAGVLAKVHVREGQIVEENDPLAQIDDMEARLIAKQMEAELKIARRQSENDVEIRYARKNAEVAEAELQRALDSVATFPGSVSQSEIDRLQLAAQRSVLGVEQAEFDVEILKLTAEQKQAEYDIALRGQERRKVVTPIAGMIVQVNARRGEWVKPGEPVIRVLRVDRLWAEGFLHANRDDGTLTGRPVRLAIDLPGRPDAEFTGRVVFVSPEVNPVNHQVRIRAEIENRGLLLRPGLQAKLTITAETN